MQVWRIVLYLQDIGRKDLYDGANHIHKPLEVSHGKGISFTWRRVLATCW